MKINHCGGKRQEEMSKNGWWMELKDFHETPEEMYDRLSQKWGKVKVYWCGTRISGIHSYFAFCKDRKYLMNKKGE